jgi:hypothetical protein
MFVSVLNYQRNRYLSADHTKSRVIPAQQGQHERLKCERILSFFNYRKESTEKYIDGLLTSQGTGT